MNMQHRGLWIAYILAVALLVLGLTSEPSLIFVALIWGAAAGVWHWRLRRPEAGPRRPRRLPHDLYGFAEHLMSTPEASWRIDEEEPEARASSHRVQLLELIQGHLDRLRPTVNQQRPHGVWEFALGFDGDGVPPADVWNPTYLLVVLLSPDLHQRVVGSLRPVLDQLKRRLVEGLKAAHGGTIQRDGGFRDDDEVEAEVARCVRSGLKIHVTRNPGDDRQDRVFLGLRRIVSPAVDKGRCLLFPREESGTRLFGLSAAGDSGHDVASRPVQHLLLPAEYTLFSGDGGLDFVDLDPGREALHGRFFVRPDGQLENEASAAGDPAAELGLDAVIYDRPMDILDWRQAELKGRIQPRAFVFPEAARRPPEEIRDHPFDDLSSQTVNVLGGQLDGAGAIQVKHQLGVDVIRPLLIADPLFRDAEYKTLRERVASGAGNFALEYRHHQAERRPRWFIRALGGCDLRYLSGLKALETSELNVDHYTPVGGEPVLVPAAELFLATRPGDGPWLILYLETATSVGFQEDAGSAPAIPVYADETEAEIALERLLVHAGLKASVEPLPDPDAAGEAMLRFLRGGDFSAYVKIPDGQEADRHERAVQRLLGAGVERSVPLAEIPGGDFDVCLARVNVSGVPVDRSGFVMLFTPPYRVLSRHLPSLDAAQALAAAAAFHRQIEDGFETGLLAGDLHPSNVGYRDSPRGRRFRVFDFGAWAQRPIRHRLDLKRREGIYLCPELDGPGADPSSLDDEALQVWLEGLLFFQLLIGEPRVPAALNQLQGGDAEAFSDLLESELSRVPEGRPRLGPLVTRMLSWEPAGRPRLAEVGGELDRLGVER